MARIVDAVVVDQPRIGEAAQLQHVMPVAPIAREARDLEAEPGADRTGAEARDELLETRPRGAAAGARTHVVVDHLDAPEPVRLGGPDQIVLAALALEARDHLAVGRVAHVDDGLAPQQRGRAEGRSPLIGGVLRQRIGGRQQQEGQHAHDPARWSVVASPITDGSRGSGICSREYVFAIGGLLE